MIVDGQQQLVQAFGGPLDVAHRAACAVAKQTAMRAVPQRFDVVVTTNSGFPLDQNLYQSVKGMSAAAQVVKPGGTIVCAAECRDGFPDHGSFRDELTALASPQLLLDAIAAREQTVPDQWNVQVQASIQSSARVVMHTSYLSDDDLAAAHLEQTSDIGAFVEEALEAAGAGAQRVRAARGAADDPVRRVAAALRSAAVTARQREQHEELRHQEPGGEPEHRVERARRVAHGAEAERRGRADRVAEPEHHRDERADALRRSLEVERQRHHEREQPTLRDAGEERTCVRDARAPPRARRRR